MYWFNGIAKALAIPANSTLPSSSAIADDIKSDSTFPAIVAAKRTRHGSLFGTITINQILLWSIKVVIYYFLAPLYYLSALIICIMMAVLCSHLYLLLQMQPIALLSKIERTPAHLHEFGHNISFFWKPDATALVVITSKSYLLIYSIIPFEHQSYSFISTTQLHLLPGPGESNGVRTMLLKFQLTLHIEGGVACGNATDSYLMIGTLTPPCLQLISWDQAEMKQARSTQLNHIEWLLGNRDGLSIREIMIERGVGGFIWRMSDGRCYFVRRSDRQDGGGSGESVPQTPISPSSSSGFSDWSGLCFHGATSSQNSYEKLTDSMHATCLSANTRFSLVAIGTTSGFVYVYTLPTPPMNSPATSTSFTAPTPSHTFPLSLPTNSTSPITSMAWTSDGYALATGSKADGVVIWSVFGGLGTSLKGDSDNEGAQDDTFLVSVENLFWNPGNHSLVVLTPPSSHSVENQMISAQLFSLPFIKSAIASTHSPETTHRPLLIADDRILFLHHRNPTIFGGTEWNQVSVPNMYLGEHWPLRYVAISQDGRCVAVAGRRGLAHYGTALGRWKMFGNQQQERSFLVRGGMVWYKHILVVGCEDIVSKAHELRLYSRENNLDNIHMLHNFPLPSPLLHLTSIPGTPSFLVYCADYILYQFVVTNFDDAALEIVKVEQIVCLEMNPLIGNVAMGRVRAVGVWGAEESSYSIKDLPLLILLDSNLILLEPIKNESTITPKYKSHIIASQVEYYWIATKSVGNLRNSLWVFGSGGVKVFSNILPSDEGEQDSGFIWRTYAFEKMCQNTIEISLDFYPLAVSLHKGIIRGIEQQVVIKNGFEFAMFKFNTKTQLFFNYIFRYLLSRSLEQEAMTYSQIYAHLDYFGHALEILLHQVLEDEAEKGLSVSNGAVLPAVIRFLDGFPEYFDVIVNCARKTEVALWDYLFSIVGDPKELFEVCIAEGRLKTATSYLIILNTLQPLAVGGKDTIRLLKRAIRAQDYELCKELVRFLNSIDSSGKTLQEAVAVIKSLTDGGPLSPRTEEAQIERVAQQMEGLGIE